jgi:hypothetical protein
MKSELIARIIFFGSFFGIFYFVFKKIPILVSLSEIERKKESSFSVLKRKIKDFNPFKRISYEKILQKIIFKIRILSLKTDNKTFQWLQNLRKKEREKKESYWQEIKRKLKK